jgi:protein-S-isoprenylcysteine O-methyltransferase Ste14
MQIEKDSAQVRMPPPLLLLSALVLGWALGLLRPWPLLEAAWRWAIGLSLFLVAIAVMRTCLSIFRRHQTAVQPWKPSSALLAEGPYRFSRNPIYLCFLIFGSGIAFMASNAWMLVLMLPLALALRFLVIAKEEKYLEGKFGQAYLDYKGQVRRWI